MRITVVIRCRNEERHIGRLLTGILRQRVVPDHIVLVDSGSTDATLSIAAKFPVDVVHISQEDFSFGAACNVGCAATDADIVVFVSAHCYPTYDTWLERLAAPFETGADVACSYGRQVAPASANYSERRILATWYPARSVPRQRHPFSNNANAAIRRNAWEEAPYDEHLTGLEDLDWAKRAIARGHVLSYVAEASVVHVHEETWGQIVNRYRREAIAHKEIYEEQRMSMLDALRLATVNIARDLREAHRDDALAENIVAIPGFRIAQFYGTYEGFAQQGPVPELLRRRFFYPERIAAEVDGHYDSDPGTLIDYDEPAGTAEVG